MGRLQPTMGMLRQTRQSNEPFRWPKASMSSSGIKGDERHLGPTKLTWDEYKFSQQQGLRERQFLADIQKFQIQETRLQQAQVFKQKMEVQKYEDAKVKNTFYQMQEIYMKAKDNPAFQDNIIGMMQTLEGNLNPYQKQELSAFVKTGALKDQKMRRWVDHNPKPQVTADVETDPNSYYAQVGMREDWKARKSAFATGDKIHLPKLRIMQSVDGSPLGLLREKSGGFTVLNEQALDVKNQLPEGYSMARYAAEGQVTTNTDIRHIDGKIVETTSGYDLTGKKTYKQKTLGEATDIFRAHPQAPFIHNLKTAFATQGQSKDEGTNEIYKSMLTILDQYNKDLNKAGDPFKAEQAINNYTKNFMPDLNFRVFTEHDPKGLHGFVADMSGFKDLKVSMFPGQFVDLGNGNGFYYDEHGNTGYDDDGAVIGKGSMSELAEQVMFSLMNDLNQ